MWSFIVKLFSNCTSDSKPTKKNRTELLAMDKRQLEAHARHYGVELDRRKKRETLVNETLQAQIDND